MRILPWLLLLSVAALPAPALAKRVRPAPEATATEAPAAHAARLLAAARAAAGGKAWEHVRLLHMTGTQETGAESGEEEIWAEPQTGRLRITVGDGPFAGSRGYDGSMAWRALPDTIAHVETGPVRADIVTEAYWRSFLWARPDLGRASADWLREESQGGRRFDVVEIAPAGGKPFELWLDKGAHLPARIVERRSEGDRIIRLSEWRRTDGVALPRRIEMELPASRQQVLETITNIETDGRFDPSGFAPPTKPPVDYLFPAGTIAVELPMKVLNGHVFIEARVAKTRLTIMFDSTSAGALDAGAAKRLGLATRPDGKGGTTVRVPKLTVGGVVFRHQTLQVRDLSGRTEVEGIPVDGVLGYELLKELVVELDFDGRRMVLIQPDGFVPPPNAVAERLGFAGRVPTLAGRLDGIPITLAIDTGSEAPLAIHPGFAQAQQLAKRWREVPAILGWRGGKPIEGAIAHADSLELGVLGIAQPLATLPPASDMPGDAQLGGGMLRRFDAIFDYKQDTLYLQRNRDADRPDTYDRAGLWINRAGDQLVVAALRLDGPGARAGLETGDVIESADGDKAMILGLPDLRMRFRAAPGHAVDLRIRRGGAYRNVRVVLADPFAAPRADR